jgi:UDP-N-acetylmuramoyl-tripeptide--D-alanyl-D-alanine ligase
VDIIKFYNLFIESGFKFSTDSRSIEKNCIFFALKGENFNGNKFALKAIEDGASYAVVDEDCGDHPRLVVVEDVLTFFQKLALFHRRCFDIPIIAVGGSNGKTTTKNLMYSVLSKKYRTHCTAGNFNNHIGVPITLLQIPQNCEIAIIELGTNNPGEIKELCETTEPNFGLITNIGKEHLEGFGNLEAVAKEESEIYHYLLKNDGLAFVNKDDDWLVRMSRSIAKKRLFGKSDVNIHSLVPYISFEDKEVGLPFRSELMGDYNLDNILTAISIGKYFEVPLEQIQQAILDYKADNNRSQIVESKSNLIWLDAYNANPSSMQKAIENFSNMPQTNKILILGDMFEMGETANQEHLELLQWAIQFNFDHIYLLGDHFAAVSKECNIPTFTSMEELGERVQSQNYNQTAFLVKGSRGMKMERVVDYL